MCRPRRRPLRECSQGSRNQREKVRAWMACPDIAAATKCWTTSSPKSSRLECGESEGTRPAVGRQQRARPTVRSAPGPAHRRHPWQGQAPRGGGKPKLVCEHGNPGAGRQRGRLRDPGGRIRARIGPWVWPRCDGRVLQRGGRVVRQEDWSEEREATRAVWRGGGGVFGSSRHLRGGGQAGSRNQLCRDRPVDGETKVHRLPGAGAEWMRSPCVVGE